jgi:hypothetical protein
MVPAIHSSKYLFSILQHLLRNTKARRLRLTTLTKQALTMWLQAIQDSNNTPVPITTLIPHAPHYYAAVDASGQGMGGFWLPTTLTTDTQPVAWRHPWTDSIRNRLVQHTSPGGDINMSELELAALVTGHHLQLNHTPPQRHTTSVIATDNTPTQAWVHSGSVSTIKPPAFLLHLLAHDCRAWTSQIIPVFAPGTTNTISDFLSRSFFLSDAELLDRLNTMAPVQPPWKLVTPPDTWVSKLNLAISRQPLLKESLLQTVGQQARHGRCGMPFVETYTSTPSYKNSQTPCPSYNFSLQDIGWEQYLPPVLQSNLERWRAPFVPLGRRSPYWASATPDFSPLESSTYAYTDNSKLMLNKIRHPPASNPYPCKSYNISYTNATSQRTKEQMPLHT